MRALVVILVVAGLLAQTACGDSPVAPPDGPPVGVVDAPSSFVACGEFSGPGMIVPVHLSGSLAGADLISPNECATVHAPFGVESAGPDAVIRVDGLVAGTTYVVRVTGATDLGFYVVTGCSTAAGPAASECLMFQDATDGGELGSFVADASSVYVVVDYYAATSPGDLSYTLDVYAEECAAPAQCSNARPVCFESECVECASSFDCTTGEKSRCDVASHTCRAGTDACSVDDAGEPANDGPAGATELVLDGTGQATHAGTICATPRTEADYVRFEVTTVGETWDFALAWPTGRDVDLQVFDAVGTSLALSYWERPERARLTYLVPGTYFARITEYASSPNASGLAYTLTATRTTGAGCTAAADCAEEYRNQIFRGACTQGSCVAIEGAGAVAEGGTCDSQSDCAGELSCPSFYFVADADTRETCARECTTDAGCDPGYVCTTYLPDNFCVQRCTSSQQCPTAILNAPSSGPWARLACDVPSGRCLP